jgi:hypothetical protein
MDISPDKQNIDRVFSNTAYYIDFNQRDYPWTGEPFLRLTSMAPTDSDVHSAKARSRS